MELRTMLRKEYYHLDMSSKTCQVEIGFTLKVAILAQGSRDPGAMAPGPLEPWVGMAFAVPR